MPQPPAHLRLSCSQGGESQGLARLTKSLQDKDWVVQFEKPKGNPAALEPATTVLSPYLKFGCVSARLFYAKLVQVGSSCPWRHLADSSQFRCLWALPGLNK